MAFAEAKKKQNDNLQRLTGRQLFCAFRISPKEGGKKETPREKKISARKSVRSDDTKLKRGRGDFRFWPGRSARAAEERRGSGRHENRGGDYTRFVLGGPRGRKDGKVREGEKNFQGSHLLQPSDGARSRALLRRFELRKKNRGGGGEFTW